MVRDFWKPTLAVWLVAAGWPAARGQTPSERLDAIIKRVDARLLSDDIYVRMQEDLEIETLPLFSLSEQQEEAAFHRDLLKQLDAVDAGALNERELVSYGVLRWNSRMAVEGARHFWLQTPITPYGSWFRGIHQMLGGYRVDSPAKARAYLDLLAQYPVLVEGLHGHLRRQTDRGIVLPKAEIDLAAPMMSAMTQSLEQTPFYIDANRLALPETEAAAFHRQAADEIENRIQPAIARLRDFIDGPYRARAPDRVGLWQYPGGEAYYRHLVKRYTTMDISPEEVHQIGLDAVTRVNGEMAALRDELGFEGSKAAFHRFLKTDKRFFRDTPEQVRAVLMGYLDGMKAKLDQLILRWPETPFDVRRLNPALEGSMTFGYYQPASPGFPTGVYYFNGSKLDQRPLADAESLIYHEILPGHHLQVSIQNEAKNQPLFRRYNWYAAYGEGWAEYAASLGREVGLYQDPYDRYGRLASAMFFAVRLVVDTGMNHMRWPREKAMAFMRENLLRSDAEIRTETLRYSCDIQGQALAYAMGAYRIRELRGRAEKALGQDFDLRAFHQLILEVGPVPMAVLADCVDRFIEKRKRR